MLSPNLPTRETIPIVRPSSFCGAFVLTKNERARVADLVQATEFLLLENLALKLVLEHREVPNWHKLLDRLMADKELLAGVHLRFRDVHGEIATGEEPALALQILLGRLPLRKPQ